MSVSNLRSAFGWALLTLFAGCEPKATGELTPPRAPTANTPTENTPALPGDGDKPGYDRIPRSDFNRLAVEYNLPLFWRNDANADGALQPGELAITWSHTARPRAEFVDDRARFTPAFSALYEQLAKPTPADGLTTDERKRRAMVRLELAQGRPTLVESDFAQRPDADKKLVSHLQRVAVLIERIYAQQKGSAGLETQLAPDDPASAALFFRNQGPECAAPQTERDPNCHALPLATKPVFGLYPAELQQDPKFCETLGKEPNRAELLDHFAVVVKGDKPGSFKALEYSRAYANEMTAIAAELEAAANDLAGEEPALKAYLSAAAQSFRDNDWERANRAWAKMGTDNSKYYLRVGPDEVYFEPCAWKAGFALAFARINPDSVEWRKRLEPIKQELENDLAGLAGKPYRARSVGFKLPDFIDIVLNAGDNRAPIGATVGQSLPNWGPVAESGGRTVTMTNLYTDDDSQKTLSEQMSSLYCAASMKLAVPKPSLMGIVLHEAAHNLGPAHDYAVNGKVDSAIFGGPLASTLEELKAQTAALYLPAGLVARHLITQAEADTSQLQEVAWTFGQVAQGMYDPQGKPKNYSQLAAIQLGSLTTGGAVEWKPNELAANGTDRGCYEVQLDKWNQAASGLAKQVLQLKARGDKAAAEALKKRWVDDEGAFKEQRALIATRWLRSPKSTFVYSITGL
ncbi:MAG TPA: hypothetical protein VER11_22540 [Polyangiaceae bacterium]|nr:hypothetical protein [Polyangiaceae bacterium]